MKQCTIKTPVSVQGVGLHTGKSVTLTFKPAAANHGYRFQRIDLPEQPVIPADVKLVISTNRSTTLKSGEVQVSTIEHVLSALTGMSIDNVLLEIDGPEMPIMDGTSMPFVLALQTAGRIELDIDRDYFVVTEPVAYKDEVTGTELLALPSENFEATVNQVIFKKGDPSSYFYIIISGSIRISDWAEGEDSKTLYRGSYFGDLGIYSKATRSATATAETTSYLVGLKKENFLRISL